jgi:2-C-methyl-D-erythritol 4-phosphate cytidylyltransferase
VTRLREALRDAPVATRVLIYSNDDPRHQASTNNPPPLAEGRVGVVTIPVSDTVKEVVEGRVRRTVPRETLVQVIGPWVFDREALVDAMPRVAAAETAITDMIGFCEAAHVRVRVLPVR